MSFVINCYQIRLKFIVGAPATVDMARGHQPAEEAQSEHDFGSGNLASSPPLQEDVSAPDSAPAPALDPPVSTDTQPMTPTS